MPASKNITDYDDVAAILTAALERSGADGYVIQPTYGKAVYFVQRCYTYRKLFCELQRKGKHQTEWGTTIYDNMLVTIDPEGKKDKDQPCKVFITRRSIHVGTLYDSSGTVIPVKPIKRVDALEEEAQRLFEEMGGLDDLKD